MNAQDFIPKDKITVETSSEITAKHDWVGYIIGSFSVFLLFFIINPANINPTAAFFLAVASAIGLLAGGLSLRVVKKEKSHRFPATRLEIIRLDKEGICVRNLGGGEEFIIPDMIIEDAVKTSMIELSGTIEKPKIALVFPESLLKK